MSLFRFTLVAGLMANTLAAGAQAITAVRVPSDETIVVDGRLDEASWRAGPGFDSFLEFEPSNGAVVPPDLRTQVRLSIDGQALVFGIRAWDAAPAKMQGLLARRDKVGSDQDFIGIWIDPTGQGQSAQFVRVNIAGVLTDGIARRGADDDLGPDYPIDAAVTRLDDGYSMEVRWPLASLRFPYSDGKPWRVMVERSVPHAGDKMLLSVPLKSGAINYMAEMTPIGGMGDTVESVRDRRFFELRPELTLRRPGGASLGLEINARPRADWIFNATINPDFSQVEIDEPTSGASRIALSLPEKRGFFLESADVLGLPLAPFYSRTIADPQWGMRATWRGAAADATFMSLRDRDGGIVLRGGVYATEAWLQTQRTLASFARARLHRGSNAFGAFTSMRDYGDAGRNLVAGLDGQFDFGGADGAQSQLAMVLMRSQTTARFTEAGPVAGQAAGGTYLWTEAKYSSDDWINDASLEAITPGFVNDNGFVPRTGTVQANVNLIRRLGPRELGAGPLSLHLFQSEAYVRMHAIHTLSDAASGQPGAEVVERRIRPGVWMYGPAQTRLWAELGVDQQRGRRLGRLHDVPALHWGFESKPAPWISQVGAEMSLGRRLDVDADRVGRGGEVLGMLKLRFALPFGWASELDHRVNRTWVEGGDGHAAFADTGWRWLGMLHFSPSDSLRVLAQNTAYARRLDASAGLGAFAERQVHRSLLYRHLWRHGRSMSLAWSADRNHNPNVLNKTLTFKLQWER